jgi:peptide/nickel transport system permease protein
LATLFLRRAGLSVLSLLLVSLVLFVLTRSIPDSPARIVLGDEATPAQIVQFDADHGLDRPILAQYLRWVGAIVFHGDLGKSFTTGLRMNDQVAQTLPVTLELVLVAFAVSVVVSLALGTMSAVLRDSPLDYAARLVVALVLILEFAVDRDWFPPGGVVPFAEDWIEHLRSLVLPAFCLGIFYMAVLTRMTRSSLLDVLGQDFMRTARASGLRRPRVLMYALRNALVPVVTIAGMSFGHMFGWALIIEQVFNIDGLSHALLQAIQQRDYAMVQAVVMVFTVIFVVANLCADVINASLNPRMAML